MEYDRTSLPKSLVPFFTLSFSFKKHIVWNSSYSPSKVRFFVALAGYGGLDSCLHRTKLSQYIILLLKLFCWLSVTLQIDFKIHLPYKDKDCFAWAYAQHKPNLVICLFFTLAWTKLFALRNVQLSAIIYCRKNSFPYF